MRIFEVPRSAFIELANGSRFEIQIAAIEPDGIWVEPLEPITLERHAFVRVIFRSPIGALGINAEVVGHLEGKRELGLELGLAFGDDRDTRAVLEAWSRGDAATIDGGRRLDESETPTLDLVEPGPASEATEDLDVERPSRASSLRPAVRSASLAALA